MSRVSDADVARIVAKITYAALVAAVRAQAEAHPQRVYLAPDGQLSCSYLNGRDKATGDGCGCIVGSAALALGAAPFQLDDAEGELPDSVKFAVCLDIPHEEASTPRQGHSGPTVTAREAAWLTKAQNLQDCGDPWGVAVAKADAQVPLS
jgi:hypothetical protein